MDPDACLARIASALEDHDLEEALEASLDLKDWLCSGGFEPNWDAHLEAKTWFHAQV